MFLEGPVLAKSCLARQPGRVLAGKDWSLPRSHAKQAILLCAGQKTLGSWVRLPPAFFFWEKLHPQILDMPARPNLADFRSNFGQILAKMFRGRIFRGNSGWGGRGG